MLFRDRPAMNGLGFKRQYAKLQKQSHYNLIFLQEDEVVLP
jgi:hypothetical protein